MLYLIQQRDAKPEPQENPFVLAATPRLPGTQQKCNAQASTLYIKYERIIAQHKKIVNTSRNCSNTAT